MPLQPAPGWQKGIPGAARPAYLSSNEFSLSRAGECPEKGRRKFPDGWPCGDEPSKSSGDIQGWKTSPECHTREDILHGLSSLAQLWPCNKFSPLRSHSVSKIQVYKLVCTPREKSFNLSSLEPPGSAKAAENQTQNQRSHEQPSAFGGGELGVGWGKGEGASERGSLWEEGKWRA